MSAVWQLIGNENEADRFSNESDARGIRNSSFHASLAKTTAPRRRTQSAASYPTVLKLQNFFPTREKCIANQSQSLLVARRFYVIKSGKKANWPNRTEGCEPDKPNDFFHADNLSNYFTTLLAAATRSPRISFVAEAVKVWHIDGDIRSRMGW